MGESYIQGEMRIVPKKGGSQQNGRGVYIERRVWMDGGGEEGRGGGKHHNDQPKEGRAGHMAPKTKGRRRRTIVVGETTRHIVNGARKDRAQALRRRG